MLLQPAGLGQALALGTVAVSARVIGGVFKATQVALLHVASQCGGTTVFDRPHDPAVRRGQAMSAVIVLAILTEDMGQFALRSCRRIISDSQHVVGLDH